jgi:hypothetical protein
MTHQLLSHVPAWLPYQVFCAGLAALALRKALGAFESFGALVSGRR